MAGPLLLEDALYNVLLWTPGKVDSKKSPTKGEILIDGQSVVSTDGYIIIQADYATASDKPLVARKWIAAEDAKAFVKGEAFGVINYLEEPSGSLDYWEGVMKFISHPWEKYSTDPIGGMAVAPERFQKFSLLRPRDTYPIDLLYVESSIGQPMLAFRHGPHVRGLIALLNRDHLEEVYLEEEGVLW